MSGHVLARLSVAALVISFNVFPAGAVAENGQKPYYAEECASMLAVTFSSGGKKLRSIVSTQEKRPIVVYFIVLDRHLHLKK